MRKIASLILFIAWCVPSLAFAAWAQFQATSSVANPTYTAAWQTLSIGGGGLVPKIYAYADGMMLAVTDTNGAFIWTPAANKWSQLITSSSLPSAFLTSYTSGTGPFEFGQTGAYEATACAWPTSSSPTLVGSTSNIWAVWGHMVLVSTDQGATFASTSLTITTENGNDATQKQQGSYLYCDPNSSGQIVYVSSPSAAGYYTSNGGTTFTQDASPAPTTNYGTLYAGDPTSSVVSGVTQTVYKSVYGSGIYRSTNGGPAGGGSWSLISGSPTTVKDLKVSPFGVPYALTTGNLYRCPTTCTSVLGAAADGDQWTGFAIDPASASEAALKVSVMPNFGQRFAYSSNAGSGSPSFTSVSKTWSGTYTCTNDVTWLCSTNQAVNDFDNVGPISYDANSNLIVGIGIGVMEQPGPITTGLAAAPTYQSLTRGIENLVGERVVDPPGGPTIIGVADRGVFTSYNQDVYPAAQYTNLATLAGAWSVDYAGTIPQDIVATNWGEYGGSNYAGTSTTGGVTFTTWANFPTVTSQAGVGLVAATDANNIITNGQNSSSAIQCSSNGAGSAWSNASGPPNETWVGNGGFGTWGQRFTSDRVTAGVFYVFHESTGVWSSTNGACGTWTHIYSGNPGPGFGYQTQFLSAPWEAGVIWYVGGAPTSVTHPYAGQPVRSTNGGGAWGTDTTAHEARAVGFGAPKPGGTGVPTVAVVGWSTTSGGSYGTYYGPDGATPTWTAVVSGAEFANSNVDFPVSVSGNPNVYGNFKECFHGSGCAYADTQDACPNVAWTWGTYYPNASLTGSLTLQAQHSGLVPVSTVSFFDFYSGGGGLVGSQSSGSGTPTTYSQSWNASSVTGAHTLVVATAGYNTGCTINQFNGTVSGGTTLTVNSGTAPLVGHQVSFYGVTNPPIVTGGSGSTFTISPAQSNVSSVAMVAGGAMFQMPVTTH